MMRILEDPQQCYGCTACFNACGTGAITMVANAEGFLEPVIDQDACIECGKCQKACPIVSPQTLGHGEPLEVLGFVADKATVQTSASGGAFTVLAKHMVAESGYVAGAVLDEDYHTRHRLISDEAGLEPLRLSKYMQSEQGSCYAEVKELLKRGERVLYTGCPCQIAGLRSYLGKTATDSLVTVDLICHGTPSAQLFNEYLEDFYDLDEIRDLTMRRPDLWSACVSVSLRNGTRETRAGGRDPYLKTMLSHYALRLSCYGCAYSRVPRQGDITIGDFWGAKTLDVDKAFKGRSSVVLLNSEKGREFWNKALASRTDCRILAIDHDVPLERVNKHIIQASTTKGESAKRAEFMKRKAEDGFVKAAYYKNGDYNVGLIPYMFNNYGSTATNVALYHAVKDLGYSPLMMDSLVAPQGVSADYLPNHMAASSAFMNKKDWRMANRMLDTFILGSDQSLNWDFKTPRANFEALLLCFADDSKNLVAYSTSLGHERYSVNKDIQLLYTNALARFNSFSVREDYAVDMCEKLFNRQADHVVDPVFLMAPDAYRAIAADSTDVVTGPYLYAYILTPDEGKRALILEIAEKLGLRAVVSFDATLYEEKRAQFNLEQSVDKPDFPTWLGYIANASFVITDSFHGVCLSTIMHKPFIGVKARQKQRFDSFEASMGFAERGEIVLFDDSNAALGCEIPTFDWDALEERVAAFRTQSVEWLRQALAGRPRPSTAPTGARDMLMGLAPMVRNKVAEEARLRVSFDEAKRKLLKADRDKGKAVLDTQQHIAGAKNSAKGFDLQRVKGVGKLFEKLHSSKRFMTLISTKGDCTGMWEAFIAQSGFALQKRPDKKEGYVSVIDESGVVLFEGSRLGTMTKRFTVDSGSISGDLKKMYRLRNNRRDKKLKSVLSPAQVSIHAGTFDETGKGDMRSSIQVNNIECCVDGEGVNIVFFERTTGKIADSVCITAKGGKLQLRR